MLVTHVRLAMPHGRHAPRRPVSLTRRRRCPGRTLRCVRRIRLLAGSLRVRRPWMGSPRRLGPRSGLPRSRRRSLVGCGGRPRRSGTGMGGRLVRRPRHRSMPRCRPIGRMLRRDRCARMGTRRTLRTRSSALLGTALRLRCRTGTGRGLGRLPLRALLMHVAHRTIFSYRPRRTALRDVEQAVSIMTFAAAATLHTCDNRMIFDDSYIMIVFLSIRIPPHPRLFQAIDEAGRHPRASRCGTGRAHRPAPRRS